MQTCMLLWIRAVCRPLMISTPHFSIFGFVALHFSFCGIALVLRQATMHHAVIWCVASSSLILNTDTSASLMLTLYPPSKEEKAWRTEEVPRQGGKIDTILRFFRPFRPGQGDPHKKKKQIDLVLGSISEYNVEYHRGWTHRKHDNGVT